MSDVTRLIDAAATGDSRAAADLLPLVYSELRELAAARMTAEPAGHTLTATALVHEAYVRLVDVDEPQSWNGRGHFFAAAAESMRRILVDRARARAADKRGGRFSRLNVDDIDLVNAVSPDQLLAIDEALARLQARDPAAGQLVKLRYFAGLTVDEAGQALGISTATAYRHWKFARAWLYSELEGNPG